MDALIKAALDRVVEAIESIDLQAANPAPDIARAVHAVDALKSALKTLKSTKPQHFTLAEEIRDPEKCAEYLRVSSTAKSGPQAKA
jgi:hypothetical protein